MARRLPVHEQFYSFQGEGFYAGRAAYFIRLFGCPVHCPWCDSAGTWHPDHLPRKIQRLDVNKLAESATATPAEFTVITGGEPAIHDLSELCEVLKKANHSVHLETSGAFSIKGDFDWITLSPKRWKLPLEENIHIADEFKLIVDTPTAIQEYDSIVNRKNVPIWLHPEWSRHKDPIILNTITEWIKQHGAPYRGGWQLHKNYGADLLDPGSAPLAPLGGDISLGY
ncbi:MAG: 7-carboxy-7-deazaguanine synthase QueE [Puniceicoccaceae bacterium]|nr:7-carboxy-7-deazaguanine synthase QueE [Puniceicoccaceae bacterium]